VADNGGDWFFSGAPDDRMPDDEINALKGLAGSDFEAVQSVDAKGSPLTPGSAVLPRAFVLRSMDDAQAPFHTLTGRWLPPQVFPGVTPVIRSGSLRILWNHAAASGDR
jgi:hypothetical protein